MIEQNVFSLDQYANMVLAAFMLGLAVLGLLRSRRARKTAVAVLFVAFFNLVFYYIAITTPINEIYRFEYASLSGIRTFVTDLILCGLCIQIFRDRQ